MIGGAVHKKLCKEFEESARDIGSCIKWEIDVPREVKKRFYVALDALRFFLDANGLRMPTPRVRYNANDESTWAYKG